MSLSNLVEFFFWALVISFQLILTKRNSTKTKKNYSSLVAIRNCFPYAFQFSAKCNHNQLFYKFNIERHCKQYQNCSYEFSTLFIVMIDLIGRDVTFF